MAAIPGNAVLVGALVAVLGGTAGVATSMLTNRLFAVGPHSSASSPYPEHKTAPVGKSPPKLARLKAKGFRVREGDAGAAIRALPSGTGEADAPRTDEEWGEHRQQVHDEKIRLHQTEAYDEPWAKEATALLEGELHDVAKSNDFKVIRTQCRTTSCTAVFEWETFTEALETYGDILQSNYKANCGCEILLPTPEDPTARYQATAVFDCAEWRAEAAPSP